MPTLPFRWMWPGMIPILQPSGVMTPGQFGPMSRDFDPASARLTFTMSWTGMPSVMQTMSGTSASMASRMASAAKAGGTYMAVASQLVALRAAATVSNTGRPRWVDPPLPGVTPPTIRVP